MKLIVKKLQGGECTLEVHPTTVISEIKRQVAQKLCIPADEQKLLFLGRTLVDEHTIQSYSSIKEGSKLNLVVKKPEGIYDVALKAFKKAGMSEAEAKDTTTKFLKVIHEKLNKLSWDDIDRLAMDCLKDEPGPTLPSGTEEMIM